MAFSAVTAVGFTVGSVSASTLVLTVTANVTVGQILFIAAVSDNIAPDDGDTTSHDIADSSGNTYTRVFERTVGGGGAGGGSTTSLWFTKVTTQLTSASGTVTLTLASAVTDSVITAVSATIGTGNTVAFTTGNTPSATGSSLSHTLSGLTNQEYLFFGLMGAEGEDTSKATGANYTEHHDRISSAGGAANTNVQIHVQTRILTGTGDTVTSTLDYTDGLQSLTAFYETTTATLSTLKYWTGAAWVSKPLNYFNGSSWQQKTLKRWDGSQWVIE